MHILGISAGFHDAAITLLKDDQIVFAGHSERYSKHKHDAELHQLLFEDCYSRYGVPDIISYYERPWLKKTRQLYAGQWDQLLTGWDPRTYIPDHYALGRTIKTQSHHLSHAAAGFQTSPYTKATVVVIDAIGEWDTVTIWDAEYDRRGEAQYRKLWSQRYPHSIGLLYSAFTKQVGLKPLDEEYILMGMSSFDTSSEFSNDFKNWLVENEREILFKDNLHLGLPESQLAAFDKFATAAGAQDLTENLIYNVMRRAREIGTSQNLVYMGGVALNCLANRHLGDYFDNIWIMPNPGDAGSSLGAAALIYKKQLDWQGPYLGHNIPGEYPVENILTELLTNQIAGVASGRAEFGPRALGNRSLLADPRGIDIKQRVNQIKRRQQFRPFAPVILEEYVHEYFDMPHNFDNSPYMQAVAKCRYPDQFPAIVHVDGTSRVQTVSADCQSGIRKLLEMWHVWTGCPMLLNTSLNIRGEPMVNDRSDADRFEQQYGIRVLS